MDHIIITEKNNIILCRYDNIQAVWMCAALEIMKEYGIEHLSFMWAFNFNDLIIENVSVEYVVDLHNNIVLVFEKTYLSFHFVLRTANQKYRKIVLEKMKNELMKEYSLKALKINLIIAYMNEEILRRENEELKEKVSVVQDHKKEWLDSLKSYGILDIPNDNLAKMCILNDPAGIYILKDLTNEKRYVGQGKKVFTRAMQHFEKQAKDEVSKAYKSGHSFVIERVITGYKDNGNLCLNKLEADLIEYYDSYNNGYNKTKGNRNATNFRGTNI